MNNIPIKIHFFRAGIKGRIDYSEVLDYFQDQPNFEIYYDNDEVDITYTDNEFGFRYDYKITKVSQVKAIYKLDPAFLNINFMLCLPLLIPSYAVTEILNFAQKVCKQFDLSVYHESFDDVRSFNIAELHALFFTSRHAYLEEYGPGDKIFYDSEKLKTICKYQRKIDDFTECYHGDLEVHPCIPVIDRKNKEFGICAAWNIGIPTVFVPYFDFVNIRDENGDEFKIRRTDFMKFMEKFLAKAEGCLPDMFILKPKQARSSKSAVGKLRKYAIADQEFEPMRIADLLDQEK